MKQKKKVLLIGWDAADWKVINPLLDEGKMPNLEMLVNGGVMGNLATLSPALSPMLWTSIATGKRPFKHGILGFTEPDPHSGAIRPISNFSRKTRALWNILNLKGMKSNVVGWWPSHPAEPINGVIISNHFQRAVAPLNKQWPLQPGTVHPGRLEKNIARLRLHPGELSAEHIVPFVPNFDKIDQDKDHRLENLSKTISECTSIHAAATALMQLEPWDFMAVYYDSIDHFCHGFMRYHPPRMKGVPEEEFELFKGVVEGGYRYHDMMLGVLLALAGEETTVILISDHGFHPDHLRPEHVPVEPAGPAIQHRDQGIIVMKGPGIKKDEVIHGANLLDIVPTILSIYNLPVGEDMDGVPLVNAFSVRPEVASISSWDDEPGEDGTHSEEMANDPIEAMESIKQLVALGYIEEPDENKEKAISDTVRELEYNLSRSYMDANRHFEAVPILEKLMEKYREESRFGIHLLRCLQSLGRTDEAGYVLEKIVENKKETADRACKELKEWQEHNKDIKPEDLEEKERRKLRRLNAKANFNPFAMAYYKASQLQAEGDAEAALAQLEMVEKLNSENAGLHIKKGEAYLDMKQWDKAEKSFRRAWGIDRESPSVHIGLCRSLLGLRRNAMAVDEALSAIGFAYFNPAAHFFLGVALHRAGSPLKAVEALKVAVLQNPNHVGALRRLAYILEKRLNDPVVAADYKDRASEAMRRIRDMKSGKVNPADALGPKRAAATSDQDILEIGKESEKPVVPLAEIITIVSGLPRSGTSMMMQMLEAGGVSPLMDSHRPTDSNNKRGYYEDERAKGIRRDVSWLPEARGKAVKIVAQLLSRLPAVKENHYGIIFMLRELDEVLASQGDMLSDQGRKGAGMSELLLKNTFIRQLRRIRKLLAIRKVPTLYILYRDCIRDPATEAARVNAFLGGSLDEAAMAAAVDSKLYRHKQGYCK